jgi:hypothetical protein
MFAGLVDVDVSRLHRAVAEYASHLVQQHCFRSSEREFDARHRLRIEPQAAMARDAETPCGFLAMSVGAGSFLASEDRSCPRIAIVRRLFDY